MTTEVLNPELNTRVSAVATEASSIEVVDAESLKRAGDVRKVITGLIREVTDTFTPIKRAQDEAKRQTLAAERRHIEPLDRAKAEIDGRITTYNLECQRKAREEQQRLEREAAAERQRLQRIADEQAAAARRAAEAKALADRQARAAMLADIDEQAASEAMAAPIVVSVAAPVVVEMPAVAKHVPPPAIPAGSGVAMHTTWKARVTDIAKLAAHQAEHPDLALMLPNLPSLNQFARLNKENQTIPGVEFYPDTHVVGK